MKRKTTTKNVKIRLTTDWGRYLYLRIEYFSIRGCKPRKYVDNFYLTENKNGATAVSVTAARMWMREAKKLASWDGYCLEKSEYILGGKPTTLAAAGLRK